MARMRFVPLLAGIGLVLTAGAASAIYLRVEIEKVPIERLMRNMQEAIKKKPKDAQAVLNLARLHAMAFALRSEDIPVPAKRPDTIWFGYEPPLVPFRNVAKTDDDKRLQMARGHLDKAIGLYEDALKLDAKDLRAHLGYGWLLTQAGKKEKALPVLRKVAEEGWKSDQKLRGITPGSTVYTPEVASYLVPLLDKEKDRDEIATLNDRIAHLKRLPRAVTPVAVPLQPGLTARDIEDRAASVAFDADGSGLKRQWTWLDRRAAWLVHDPRQTGKIDSALQMFGNVTFWLFWETGYDAMAALDDDGDGELRGAELHGLALWHDANGNGLCEDGEVRPLSAHGIVALSCRYERDARHPDRIAFSPTGATFRDGTTRPTFDLLLHRAR